MTRSRISTIPLAAFLFSFITVPLSGEDLQLTETDDIIRVSLRGKPVLEYIKTEKPVPEGIEPHFRRSGYIHPVYTPTGQEITGDFPADHAHQHALFFAWTKATFDGKKVDFWNQAKGQGRIEFREVVELKKGERQVSFSVKHAFTVTGQEKAIDALHEIWTVTVYQTPQDHFLFDIKSVQECATAKPLILEKYHYGGMAFRGNVQWLKKENDKSIDPDGLKYLTSEGKDRLKGNHTRPNWVAFSGKLDGQDVSAAVFCSPKNCNSPSNPLS
jgi:hypothetical protein